MRTEIIDTRLVVNPPFLLLRLQLQWVLRRVCQYVCICVCVFVWHVAALVLATFVAAATSTRQVLAPG